MNPIRSLLFLAATLTLSASALAEDGAGNQETPIFPVQRDRQPAPPIVADDESRKLGHAKAARETLLAKREAEIKRLVGNGMTREDAEIEVPYAPSLEEVLAGKGDTKTTGTPDESNTQETTSQEPNPGT